MLQLIYDFEALAFEEVWIKSFDGLKLYGRYYHTQDKAPLQIQCHGYRGTAMRDFCGGSRLGRLAGHNLLVIDQRAHGKSQGHSICFGIKERYDCLSWIEYACQRFGSDTPIILSGVSMGAATVIMAAGLKLPDNVKGVVADCPYSSPYEIIKKVCKDKHFPTFIAMPLLCAAARLFAGFSLKSASPIDSLKSAHIPILIIHGEADRFVPCQMSRDLAATSSMVRLASFPDAGHGLSFIEDYDRYKKLCNEFFSEIIF